MFGNLHAIMSSRMTFLKKVYFKILSNIAHKVKVLELIRRQLALIFDEFTKITEVCRMMPIKK